MNTIYLTAKQIAEVRILRDRVKEGEIAYHDAYFEIAKMLPNLSNEQKWFLGATQANAGQGVYSAMIRGYSQRQMELRGVQYSDELMQKASDEVAFLALEDVLNPRREQADGSWEFPNMGDIANNDAVAVGRVLFASLPGDSAGGETNAGWAGALLFSALGSDQTYRLTSGSGGSGLDRLDDFKNILFAYESFGAGISKSYETIKSSELKQFFVDLGIGAATFLSSSFEEVWDLAWSDTAELLGGDAKLFADLVRNAGPNTALDWMRSSHEGKNLVGTTTDANFVTNATTFFGGLSPTEQTINVTRLLPATKEAIVAQARTDIGARNALYALSPIVVEKASYGIDLSLIDPQTGEGALSEAWIDKRSEFLLYERFYRNSGQNDGVFNMPLGLPVPIIGDIVFQDFSAASPYVLKIDGVDGGIADMQHMIFGGSDGDVINGGAGKDHLFGMAGNDTIRAGNGSDYIEGGGGADVINGGAGEDRIFGGMGNDQIEGGIDSDYIIGDAGDDQISGGEGGDIISGGTGSDKLAGNAGDDAMGGGAFYDEAADTYWLKDDLAADRLEGGNGYDYYFVDTLDVINDSDRRGVVYFQSQAQGDLAGNAGGSWWRLNSAYETEYNSGVFESTNRWTGETLVYELDGTDLSINGEVTIENYSSGTLGIYLVERNPPPPLRLPNPPRVPADPLVLDLDGDGIETVGQSAGIFFDHDNSGFKELTGWVDKDDGLLVMDRNANGIIDDGSELFGNHTSLANGANAENGFIALAQIDSNADGVISVADIDFGKIQVWQDSNSNGVADAGELLGLKDMNILQLNLGYSASTYVDTEGNAHTQQGTYTLENGIERDLVDVWFDSNTQESDTPSSSTVPADIAVLPNLQGTGNVASLHEAMIADASGMLKAQLEKFVTAPTLTERNIALEQLLFQWVGETGGYEKHYTQSVDRRKIHTLEAFYGFEIPDPQGGGWQYTEMHERLFQQFSNSIYSQLASQTHLSEYASAIVYTTNSSGDGEYDFDNLIDKLLRDVGENTATEAEALLVDIYVLVDGLNPYEGTAFSSEEGPAISAFKQQVREYIGDDIIDTMFEGYIGNIDPQIEVKLRTGADRLLNYYASTTLYDDVIEGTVANESFNGLLGDDRINGFAGDDILVGGEGNDRLIGGLGNDQYHYYLGHGNDSISNDSSDSTVDGIFIHGVLSSDLVLNRQGNDLLVRFKEQQGSIRVEGQFVNEGANNHNVQQIVLDDGSKIDIRVDTFNPVNQSITDQADVYHGSLGDDIIDVKAGDDALFGKTGNDTLSGGAGDDRIYGDEGADTLKGGSGHDFLYGGDGNDLIIGGKEHDILHGNAGDDTYQIDIGDGIDALRDSEGNSNIKFGAGIFARELMGSRRLNDLIIDFAGRPDDQVTISGFFRGNSYSESWTANFSDGGVLSSAQLAQLILTGTDANDVINGLNGVNTIEGKAGNDRLTGNSVNDTLIGGKGNDTLRGLRGSDTYLFSLGDGADRIEDISAGTDNNRLKFSADITASMLLLRRVDDNLVVSVKGTEDSVQLNRYFDTERYQLTIAFADGTALTHAEVLAAVLVSTEADDTIHAFDSDDTVNLLGGNDTAYGLAGNDLLDGGAGNDRISGNEGNDTILGGSGLDSLSGGAGNDTVSGGTGSDALDGGTGNDILDGGVGNDILHGGDGDDQLTGGEGQDRLYGGKGSDTFIIDLSAGDNVIFNNDTQSSTSTDKIVFASTITPDAVELVRINNDLQINTAANSTLVKYYFLADARNQRYLIDTLEFADTTVWDVASVKAKVLLGNEKDQVLTGYASNDVIHAAAGADTVNGNDGNDIIHGGLGNDTLNGNSGHDEISGGDGDDKITGGEGNDTLAGGGGNDQLNGGSGNDIYTYLAGDGSETIIDASGTDTLNFATFTADELIFRRSGNELLVLNKAEETSRQAGPANATSAPNILVRVRGQFNALGTKPNTAIETLTFKNNIKANYAAIQALVLVGTGLNDTIQGHALNDVISAGMGADSVTGGAGSDTLNGDAGDDTIKGNAGNDVIDGGIGHDVLWGGSGIDKIQGGDGADTLNGGSGNDMLYGGAGADTLYGDSGTDTLEGGAGDDKLFGNGHLLGGLDNDHIEGTGILDGGAGNDYIESKGADTLIGGAGNDTLVASTDVFDVANNDLAGGAGDDTLYGSHGKETYRFNLGDGKDLIIETKANEAFSNINASDDSLVFGAGILPGDIDLIRQGDDLLVAISATDEITIQNWFKEPTEHFKVDRFIFADGSTLNTTQIETQVRYQGTAADDVMVGYRAYNDEIHTGAGNDKAWGREGDDVIYGDADDDYLDGDAGNDTLYGGSGKDNLVGRLGDDTLEGGLGNDSLQGNEGKDTLYGGAGEDALFGGADNDVLHGGDARDLMDGGAGNDTLNGGAGNDQLTGGEGDDKYSVGTGDDVIVISDNHGHDIVDLSAGGVNGLLFNGTVTKDRIHFSKDANDLLISIDDGVSQTVRVSNHFLGGDHAVDWVQPSGAFQITTAQINQLAAGGANPDFDSVVNGTSVGEQLVGTAGKDLIKGLAGNDHLFGLSGNDRLEGGAGNDVLQGGNANAVNSGDDTLIGGEGNDTFLGADGDDMLDGGNGNDHYNYYANHGKDIISDAGDGQDVLFFSDVGLSRLSFHQEANDLIVLVDGDLNQQVRVENHFLGGLDEIHVQPQGGFTQTPTAIAALLTALPEPGGDTGTGGGGPNTGGGGPTTGGDGPAGNDTLAGTANNDVMIGGAGNDTLSGLAGNDHLIGGADNDTYIIGANSGSDIIIDSEGSNTIRFIDGIGFNDVASGLGRSGSNLILSIAATGNKVRIDNFFSHTNTLSNIEFEAGGSLSPAQIYGAFGAAAPTAVHTGGDYIAGDSLANTLTGGLGDDVLFGLDGNDTYTIGANGGKDLVIDTNGANKVLFTDGIAFNDVASGLSKSGDDLILKVGTSGSEVKISQFFTVANTIDSVSFESGGELSAAQIFQTFSLTAPSAIEVTESNIGINTAAQMSALVSAMSSFDVPEDAGDLISASHTAAPLQIEVA